MGFTNNISYQQILSLIHQLSEKDFQKLINALQSEKFPDKNSKSGSLQEMILNAPTWSNFDLEEYKKARDHINKSRIV